jgi:hypothetical protein
MRLKFISLLVVGAILVGGVEAHATMVRPFAPKELFDHAGYVFSGKVMSVRGERLDGTIVSRIVFRDLYMIKGASRSDSLTLTLEGGMADNDMIAVEGQPRFSVGQRYIVFATRDLGAEGYHRPVLGLGQGCYSVATDGTVHSGAGWPVVGLTRGTVTVAVPNSMRPVPAGQWVPEPRSQDSTLRIIPERQTLGKRMRESEFLEVVRTFSDTSEQPR